MAWKFGSTKRNIFKWPYSKAMRFKELDLVEICPLQIKGKGGRKEEKNCPIPLIFLIFKDSDSSRQFVGSSLYSQCLIQTSLKFLWHCLIYLHWGFKVWPMDHIHQNYLGCLLNLKMPTAFPYEIQGTKLLSHGTYILIIHQVIFL